MSLQNFRLAEMPCRQQGMFPNSIWDKPGPLTRAEFDRVERQPMLTEPRKAKPRVEAPPASATPLRAPTCWQARTAGLPPRHSLTPSPGIKHGVRWSSWPTWRGYSALDPSSGRTVIWRPTGGQQGSWSRACDLLAQLLRLHLRTCVATRRLARGSRSDPSSRPPIQRQSRSAIRPGERPYSGQVPSPLPTPTPGSSTSGGLDLSSLIGPALTAAVVAGLVSLIQIVVTGRRETNMDLLEFRLRRVNELYAPILLLLLLLLAEDFAIVKALREASNALDPPPGGARWHLLDNLATIRADPQLALAKELPTSFHDFITHAG